MQQRYIIRAHRMGPGAQHRACADLADLGIDVESAVQDQVFRGHALFSVQIEEHQVEQVRSTLHRHNGGAECHVNPAVCYNEIYAELGVDISQ